VGELTKSQIAKEKRLDKAVDIAKRYARNKMTLTLAEMRKQSGTCPEVIVARLRKEGLYYVLDRNSSWL
jgi:hypothetical protein